MKSVISILLFLVAMQAIGETGTLPLHLPTGSGAGTLPLKLDGHTLELPSGQQSDLTTLKIVKAVTSTSTSCSQQLPGTKTFALSGLLKVGTKSFKLSTLCAAETSETIRISAVDAVGKVVTINGTANADANGKNQTIKGRLTMDNKRFHTSLSSGNN